MDDLTSWSSTRQSAPPTEKESDVWTVAGKPRAWRTPYNGARESFCWRSESGPIRGSSRRTGRAGEDKVAGGEENIFMVFVGLDGGRRRGYLAWGEWDDKGYKVMGKQRVWEVMGVE